jgi:hypothetical protein
MYSKCAKDFHRPHLNWLPIVNYKTRIRRSNTLKGSQRMGDGQICLKTFRASLFNDALSNEPNFSLDSTFKRYFCLNMQIWSPRLKQKEELTNMISPNAHHLMYEVGGNVLLVPLGNLLYDDLCLVNPTRGEQPTRGLRYYPPTPQNM